MTSSRTGAICAWTLVAVLLLALLPAPAAAQAGDLPALLLTTAPGAASADGSAPAEPPSDTVLSLLDGPSEGPDVGAVVGTSPVTAAQPSPDGRFIAWIGSPPAAEHGPAGTGSVWLHDLQTGSSRAIPVSAIAWHEDLAWDHSGDTIGVTTADGAVLIDVASGRVRPHPMTEPGDGLLDVHGDRVVVSRGRALVLAPGQPPRQLEQYSTPRSARFSPDGSRIAMVLEVRSTGFATSGLYIDGPDGLVHEYSAPFDLGENFRPRIHDIAWSPDGSGIVLVDQTRQLHHRVPDGADGPGDVVVAEDARLLLGWSGDGVHVLYANGRRPVGAAEVFATRLDGSHPVLMATVPDLVDAVAVLGRPFAAPPTGDTVADALHWSALLQDPESQPVSTLILARADDFADALASGVLQGALQAPLLLTDTHVLSPRVVAELARLAPEEVVVLGGEAAVSAAVVEELAERRYAVQRIAGATRIDTAVAVAAATAPDADTVLLARAFGTTGDPSQAFADSLGAGAVSATNGQPLLLTDTGALSAATAAYLRTSEVQAVRIIGGTAAVSAAVEAGLAGLGLDVQRIAGDTRHETAAALAGAHRDDGGRGTSAVVEGTTPDSWAEGLAAALHVTVVGGDGIFLTAGEALPAATVEGLGASTGADAPTLRCGRSVPAATCDAARSAYAS